MAATCSFGISFGFGTVTGSDSEASTRNWVHEQSSIAATANHNSNNNDNDKNNNINANAFQYDDGLCPYSDEKEVVVEGGNFAEQTIWRSTATSQDHIVHEDSNSTVTAGSQGPSATQKITSALPPISKLPCIRVWRLTKNAVKNASSSTSKYLTVSMPHESNQAGRSLEFSVISRKEFEALPLTIQRKVSVGVFFLPFYLILSIILPKHRLCLPHEAVAQASMFVHKMGELPEPSCC